MKHYDYFILACIGLFMCLCLCNCNRSSYGYGEATKRLQSDSISKLSAQSTMFTVSDFIFTDTVDEDWFRLHVEYDTTQPVNSSTNLPPVKNRTIESKHKKESKKATQTKTQKENAIIDSSIIKSLDEKLDQKTDSHKEVKVLTGIENGVKWLIVLAAIAILLFIYIRYVRKKNSSK